MQFLISVKAPIRKRLAIAISTVALVSGGLALPAYAATVGTPPVIVGMGDSYTSGLGAPPYTDDSTCYRSTKAYPLLAAQTLGYTGKNIACAGTDTEDVQTTYNQDPAQTKSLGDPDWVVMTIGGNNANILGGVLQDETPIDTVISNLDDVSSAVEGVLTAVETNAPDADVILVGYPDVLPNDTTALSSCLGDQAENVDLAKEHEAFQKLNAAQTTAAQNANAIFIDTAQTFVGHDACATDPWITGIDDPDAPFHLNATGQAQIASMVVTAIEKVDGTSASSPSTSTTSSPSSTTVKATTSTTKKIAATTSTTQAPVDDTTDPTITEETTTTTRTLKEDNQSTNTSVPNSRTHPNQRSTEDDRHSIRKHHRKHHCLGHRNHRQSFVQHGSSEN